MGASPDGGCLLFQSGTARTAALGLSLWVSAYLFIGSRIMEIFLLLFVVAAVLTFRFDRKRIHEYIERRGARVVSTQWRLLGHGWMSEGQNGNRIYEVEYRDAVGNLHRVWCKTAALSGVYTSEDRIIKRVATLDDDEPVQASPEATPAHEQSDDERIAFLEEELRKARARKEGERSDSGRDK